MLAITLHQPYATLIAIGAKQIETRSWATAYRGPIAIHAAKTMPEYARDAASGCEPIYRALKAAGYTTRIELKTHKLLNPAMRWLPSSAIVATARLVDCVRVRGYSFLYQQQSIRPGLLLPPEGDELWYGDYTPGRYAWILEDIVPLDPPVPASGAQGLWEWDGRP